MLAHRLRRWTNFKTAFGQLWADSVGRTLFPADAINTCSLSRFGDLVLQTCWKASKCLRVAQSGVRQMDALQRAASSLDLKADDQHHPRRDGTTSPKTGV